MIHKYYLNGYYIVLDTDSGAAHVLDGLPYLILDSFMDSVPEEQPEEIKRNLLERFSESEIDEVYKELLELYRPGLLYSKDGHEQFCGTPWGAPVKSMCLNVAHDCNLRCEYCSAARGDFGRGQMLMPPEVGKRVIDFLIEQSADCHSLEVDFFGGEPPTNFEVVKKVVDYAHSIEKQHNKNFRFTITTNGSLLTDDKIEYINREMSNVVLSLDGRKEINDLLRVRADGRGSYDRIVPNYQKLVFIHGDKDYYMRGTFVTHNLDSSKDVLHMAELGFDQLSIGPAVSDEKLDYPLKEKDLPGVFEKYDHLANLLIQRRKGGRGFNFFHFMLDLDQGLCAIKRLCGCGRGNEYIAATPEGDIFPCHQFVGDDEWKMGNIVQGIFDRSMKQKFAQYNIYSKKDCRNCWVKLYCSDGCDANSWQYEGDIPKPHTISCELEKKCLEYAIMMKATLADTE